MLSIEVGIQIVLLIIIIKYQSETQILRQLKKQELVNLPSTHTIKQFIPNS